MAEQQQKKQGYPRYGYHHRRHHHHPRWPARPGPDGPIKKSFNQRQVWSARAEPSQGRAGPGRLKATSIIDRLFTVSQAMTLPIAHCPLPNVHCVRKQFQEMQSSSSPPPNFPGLPCPMLPVLVNAVFDFASYATYINHQVRLLSSLSLSLSLRLLVVCVICNSFLRIFHYEVKGIASYIIQRTHHTFLHR